MRGPGAAPPAGRNAGGKSETATRRLRWVAGRQNSGRVRRLQFTQEIGGALGISGGGEDGALVVFQHEP